MNVAIWVTCTGEAHSNPYIDHCMVCMPYWGEYPVCPTCGNKVGHSKKVDAEGYRMLWCKKCRKHLLKGINSNEPENTEAKDKKDAGLDIENVMSFIQKKLQRKP